MSHPGDFLTKPKFFLIEKMFESRLINCSVSDPYSLNLDPGNLLNPDSDLISIRNKICHDKFAEIYNWKFWLIKSGSAYITESGLNPNPLTYPDP